MPYKKAKYTHHRRIAPEKFHAPTFRTVPISHVKHIKKYPRGTKAIVGKLKTGSWRTQSILIPKRKK